MLGISACCRIKRWNGLQASHFPLQWLWCFYWCIHSLWWCSSKLGFFKMLSTFHVKSTCNIKVIVVLKHSTLWADFWVLLVGFQTCVSTFHLRHTQWAFYFWPDSLVCVLFCVCASMWRLNEARSSIAIDHSFPPHLASSWLGKHRYLR